MLYFQTQQFQDPNNPSLAPCLNSGLPVQETGHIVNQHSTTNAENHANFVQQPDTNLHFEDFGGEVIAVLENDAGQIEVLILTAESTPAIVEELS